MKMLNCFVIISIMIIRTVHLKMSAYMAKIHQDGCSIENMQLLSSTLDGQNFELADTAVEAAASEVNNHQWLTISLEHSR